MDKVIVIGCYIPGMAVIRALANKNLHIITMTYSENDIAHLSKYVTEVVRVPHPQKEPEQFVDCLLSNAYRWENSLILESADHTSVILSRNKELLSKHYRIVTPDWNIFETFLEKEKTYALAARCGVPHPKTYNPDSLADLENCADLQYPLMLKPVRSFEFVNKFHVKNFVVNNEAELANKFRLCMENQFPVVLQEIIPGPDENLYKLQGYINSHGEMVGKFFHRKLRQNPPHFGVMRVGISTERNPELEQLTIRLLDRIEYRGYFSIEFKKDPRDNQLKLMENNCRFPRCGLLATAAGVNYPWIIYLDLVKNEQIDTHEYKIGTYLIELYADISNSIQHHKEEDIRFWDYVRPYFARDKAFAELDFHDLKPFMKLTSEKVRNLWH
jgi:predicted ATP-grasp superfamily ATP-dependent carboligase